MLNQLQNGQEEPFFITEEIEVEMATASYKFEPPPIACTVRLRDMMEDMSDAELAFQPGEIADQECKHRQNKLFSVG